MNGTILPVEGISHPFHSLWVNISSREGWLCEAIYHLNGSAAFRRHEVVQILVLVLDVAEQPALKEIEGGRAEILKTPGLGTSEGDGIVCAWFLPRAPRPWCR